ncbi:DUF1918 domain-containing protein [Streptomyces mirabilis]
MRAHLGDQLVIEGPTTDAARRDGEIVGLHHEDGTPLRRALVGHVRGDARVPPGRRTHPPPGTRTARGHAPLTAGHR